MNLTRMSLIFIILFALGVSLFSFINNTQADTSGTVVTTVQISVCGNGILEGGEQCDGDSIGNRTCLYLGYSSGRLNCNASCEFDTSSCNTSAEENVSTTFITSIGGSQTLIDEDQSMVAELPANSYSDSLRLETFSYPFATIADSNKLPSNEWSLSNIYDLNFFDSSGDSVSTLYKPVTITLVYTDLDASGIMESTIHPYVSDDQGFSWQLVSGGTLDTENNTVIFTTTSFSWFTLLGSVPAGNSISQNSGNLNPGGKRRLVFLSEIVDKNITNYLNNVLSVLNFSNDQAGEVKNTNTEKNVRQNKESSDNIRAGSRGSKMRVTNIVNDLSSNQSVAESKFKVILASLIIVYIVLARFVVLL